MRGMIPAVRETRIGSEQAVAQIRWLAEAASGAVSVPVACPMRWSTEGYHGHSRTTACRRPISGRPAAAANCLNRRVIVSGWGGLPSSQQNSTP